MTATEVLCYIEKHPWCEACGEPLSEKTMPHHIRTRGAGGSDDEANLIRLCYKCHAYIHSHGHTDFVQWWPHLYIKIMAVKGKSDRTGIRTDSAVRPPLR